MSTDTTITIQINKELVATYISYDLCKECISSYIIKNNDESSRIHCSQEIVTLQNCNLLRVCDTK